MNTIDVYTDGSSRGNPGPGGWGVVIVDSNSKKKIKSFGGGEFHTTNNQMELKAPIEALKIIKREYSDCNINMNLDSAYVLGGVTSWIFGWEKNGWKTANKKPVLNQELWKELISEIRSCNGNITWNKVLGHSGVLYNEEADQIATTYADEFQK